MLEPLSTSQSVDRRPLAAGLRRVVVARKRLTEAKHAGVRRWEEQPLRDELLAALEGYAAAINASGAPVSHRLRAEINLYQRLGDAG